MIDIVIATQGKRFDFLKEYCLPSILKQVNNYKDFIHKVYLIVNNLADKQLSDYDYFKSLNDKIEIVEGNNTLKTLNKFIPYHEKYGFEYGVLHIDDDIVLDNDKLFYKQINAIKKFPDLVIGHARCSYYHVNTLSSRIFNIDDSIFPSVTDCITNLVHLNHGVIYFPKDLLKDSFVLDVNYIKNNGMDKLCDEALIQLWLLLTNKMSYIINDTLNIGHDMIVYGKELALKANIQESVSSNIENNIIEANEFLRLLNDDRFRQTIHKNLITSELICLVNNDNAMGFYLTREKLRKITGKQIKIIYDGLSDSWQMQFTMHNWLVN